MKHKPLLLGHRGCRGRLLTSVPTENSLAAFEYALSAGCDGFEFDVRHTRDLHNLLWHDPEWQGLSVGSTDAALLADKKGNRPVALDEVLKEFSQRAFLDIELKVAGNEQSVIETLKETSPRRGFIVSSFYPDILKRLHGLDPDLPLGFICDREDAFAVWHEMPIHVFLPEFKFVTRQLIEEAHAHGLQIMTWTVNRRDDMLRLADWGVDGLVSDDPQLLYQTFHSAEYHGPIGGQ